LFFPYTFVERTNLNGQHFPDAEIIRIEGHDYWGHDYSLTSVLCVLTHELLHAIANMTGCTAFNDDEQTIEALSHTLVQVLQDNPELTKLFLTKDNK